MNENAQFKAAPKRNLNIHSSHYVDEFLFYKNYA
jgi:hypothetical protein